MDFEEWFESRDDIGCLIGLEGYAAKEAWNARQAEIDALKEKLKKLEDHIFINYDDERDDDQHSYWSGYNAALGEIAAIIEENNNDT